MIADYLTVTVVTILSLAAAAQIVGTTMLVRLFFRPKPQRVPAEDLPKAAVLVALKGADPDLVDGLRNLLRQDYPRYEVRIVVDRRNDPAWGAVEQAIADTGATNVKLLEHVDRHETCGMHCSAVVQAARSISDDCEAIVLIDGDVVGHKDLIRDLVTPLVLDSEIGGTFGNRWYMPAEGRWGSLVRYFWNVGAVPPMYLFSIIWGGACALRRSTVRESGLIEKWERAAVIDAPIVSLFRELHKKIEFVPTLMVVNREECGMRFALDFIKRQMLWTRVYSPGWKPAFFQTVILAVLLVVSAGLVLYGIVAGRPLVARAAAVTLFGYFGVLYVLMGLIEMGVRRVVRLNGESTAWLAPATLFKLALALPLAHFVTMWATVVATFQKNVRFRASVYQVRGPWDVRIVTYRPIESTQAESKTSI